MKYRSSKFFNAVAWVGLACGLVGCAGPTSPFGAIDFFRGDGKRSLLATKLSEQIRFTPERQVLHTRMDWTVQVQTEETITNTHELKIVYNGINVTKSFKNRMASKVVNPNDIEVTFPRLRLRSDQRHNIQVSFRPSDAAEGSVQVGAYLPPDCASEGMLAILSTAPFKLQSSLLDIIHRHANHYGLNPAMLAGVIAQESAFNPKAVSWARAVGLTQVTPLADAEIAGLTPDWPRDKRIELKPIWQLRSLINEGDIQAATDWRLNPSKSIEGGALYFSYLKNYWQRPENLKLINAYAGGDATPVLLASYNSGAARVKRQMKALQDKWLESSQLKEAFKYVNRVSSYCYHFARADL